MRKKEEIEKIAELFARFRAEVENLNSLNLQGNSLDNIEFLRGNQTI